VFACAVVVFAACGGPGDEPTPTPPRITSTPASPTAADTPGATPSANPAATPTATAAATVPSTATTGPPRGVPVGLPLDGDTTVGVVVGEPGTRSIDWAGGPTALAY